MVLTESETLSKYSRTGSVSPKPARISTIFSIQTNLRNNLSGFSLIHNLQTL